jgi:hypothetical protein
MRLVIASIFFLLVHTGSIAQNSVPQTDSFVVKGQIRNPTTFTIHSLDTFKTQMLDDIVTVNHMGQALSTIKNVRGILLKDVLNKIQLNAPSPKQSFGYYMECIASDGFKTVFSWNEIFNTINGDNTYIITEKNGKKLEDIDDRIAILIVLGKGKGHVYIKGLQQIIIKSVSE